MSSYDVKFIAMASASNDELGLISITPDAAMSIAEYYCNIGNEDVIVFIDDLERHSDALKAISLQSDIFPTIELYPPDIFYNTW